MRANSKNHDRPFILIFAVAFGLSSYVFGQMRAAAPPGRSPQATMSATPTSLQGAVENFVAALREQDADALVRQFSSEGVVMEVDGDPIPLDQIRRAMRKRGQIFCMYFDTRCLRKYPSFRAETALRDLLIGAKSYRLQAAVNPALQQADKLHRSFANASLFVEGNPARAKRGDQICTIVYVLEHEQWKITLVEFS